MNIDKSPKPKYCLALVRVPNEYAHPGDMWKHQYVWLKNEVPHLETGILTESGLVLHNTLAYWDATKYRRKLPLAYPKDWCELLPVYSNRIRKLTLDKWREKHLEYDDIIALNLDLN